MPLLTWLPWLHELSRDRQLGWRLYGGPFVAVNEPQALPIAVSAVLACRYDHGILR